jgi:adenylosuccinate synthase
MSADVCVNRVLKPTSALAIEYKIIAGWSTPTTGARSFAELPGAAQEYVQSRDSWACL